jgi:hypothetical protein
MANEYTVYEVIGKKEDVSDIISNISPTDTPFQSMIGKESVSNVLFQWQEDELAAAAANAQYDGFDASEIAASPTTLRENYTQILAKAIKVAATTDAVNRYGRAKETAYQLSKRGAELKRDLEYVLLNAQAGGKGTLNNLTLTSMGNSANVAANAARTMKSFQAQVDSSLLNKTGGSGTAMTETLLNTTLQELFDAGANPTTLMIPPGEALNIASYAAATGRERDIGNEKKLVNAVNVYVSPFGEVKVILNRFQSSIDHLVFNPSDWKLAVLRAWERVPLAKVGDSERHMIVGEYSLKHSNVKASAIVRKAA